MLDATPALRAYAAWRLKRLARLDPMQAQRRQLAALLHTARRTRFGRAHGFAAIADVAEYQRRVPLRSYEAFHAEWWQHGFPRLRDATWPGLIPFLALSSGTSGGPTKHIPVSRAMLASNRRAALDTLAFHCAAHPRSRVMAGRSFLLGGSTALERLAPGVRAGDLSGIAAATMPLWARGRAFPPRRLALLADWDAKLEGLAQGALAAVARGQPITSLSGTPSWLLVLLDRLAQLRPGTPRRLDALLPGIELLVHGGVGFAPYRAAFAPWLEGGACALREVYPASEGFIAVADRGPDEGLRLLLDNGLFFEFVHPAALEDPRAERRWIADAALDTEYALVLTSNAGLWSYVLGDTVRLVERTPPRLLVTGRTSATLSAFGEHLTGGELDRAVAEAAAALGVAVTDYTAAALFPRAGEVRGGHLVVLELSGAPDLEALARALDAALARLNADYAAHRAGLRPLQVALLPPGSFARWMRGRGKLGGQNKVPRVIHGPELLAELLEEGSAFFL